ncbi:MAG: pyridoxal-dependent decarboxylase, exosortase A system-associated [Piscirickettsiaceae bacterium]|nr:MAG: pyridoxal-dependent decarboxylase, exosortase A system-associated [Piscirickettsiaceae bacterium]
MTKRPEHCLTLPYKSIDGELQINDQPLSAIIDSVGQTPFYAYDKQVMSAQVASFRQHFPDISLHYAMKANPMQDVVDYMSDLVDGLDIASVGEMWVALKSSTPAHEISFAGPGKTTNELEAAIKAGVTLNIESEYELERIVAIAKQGGPTPRVAIRVNPDFELKASGMKMAGGPKPFGIDAERVPTVLESMKNMPIHFRGFHIFSGSQNLKAESLIDAHQKTFALAIELAQHAPSPVELLNIGGGFGIPYFPNERELDLQPIADNMKQLLPDVKKQLPEAEIVIELGRFLVGPAGVYICEVVDIKESRGKTYVICNGGLHHHLAASGNFGQVIRKNYPVAIANKMDVEKTQTVSVVGPLCTPLDILADNMTLPTIERGDFIAVFQSGAYGFSASPHGFLSHPMVKEILV